MSEYQIALDPVYSKPVSEGLQGVTLPEKWMLSWHQAETYKALQDPEIDVVFNTAMTGDGKSLAAYLGVLQEDYVALGLYPTNALARDQETQIEEYIATFHPPSKPRVNRLSGPELEIYAEIEGLRKGSAIASRGGQSEVLIANPDIFHYLHRGAYLTPYDNPDKLWNSIAKDFDVFIFDEFHVFSAPQVASVLNTMLLLRATNRRKKFLFLSATPNKSLKKRLEIAEFRCMEINPIEEEKYQFPETEVEKERLSNEGWRQVSRSIDLTFKSLEPTSKASEVWLNEHKEEILDYFLEHPGSKGAIILNSIAAVKRLKPIFESLFAEYNLTVRENTGLSGSQEKEKSLAANLVIGTSTIDVGVDFKINFLIFESSDAGNFIQRLGRLSRHDGYKKDGKYVQFDRFKAYALVPNFFVEKLFLGNENVLVENKSYDRVSFHNLIRAKYRNINDFEGYYKRWGAVQSFSLARQLKHPYLQQQYSGSLEKFCGDCETVFEASLGKIARRLKGWAVDWKKLSGQKSGNPIAEDAMSFRGSSPLQCGLYDPTETDGRDRFKTYDLPGILSNLEIEMWSKKAFLEKLEETADQINQPISKGRFKHCLGFMKLQRYREERLDWKFTYPGDLQPIADAWKVQVLRNLQIWQPDNPWAGSINRRLKEQALVCYVLRKPVREVRLRLQLPMHFQIYPISHLNSIHDPNPPYSVAFGQSALLLDTLAYRFKHDGGEIWIAS